MRDYVISCEGTRKNASLASARMAPFCARVASLHASKYAPTPLQKNNQIVVDIKPFFEYTPKAYTRRIFSGKYIQVKLSRIN